MTSQHERLAAFIRRLAETPTDADAYNPFGAGDNPYNALRRANLRRYLSLFLETPPAVALIGEAPGYRGMRLSGVPFASRRLLLDGVPALGHLGIARGYQDVPEPTWEKINTEPSATIFWNALAALGVLPLVWSAFPFHPHQAGKPHTNRAPRSAERRLGAPLLEALLALFQPKQIIAVGNVAHRSLHELGYACPKVRHPSHGGKNDFVAGLRLHLQP
jgi:uracil-DNA glycosylase